MDFIFWIGIFLLGLYIVNAIFYRLIGAKLFQLRAQFPAAGKGIPDEKVVPPEDLTDVEIKWLKLSCGKIETWLLADEAKRPALIYAHGNTGFIDTNLAMARSIQALGFHVLLVEYPGYGRSSGKPSEISLTEGFCHAYDWLKSLSKVGKIGAFGNSLGCSVVARLSNERPLGWLILKSGLASFARLIASKAHIPQWLAVNPFNTLKYVSAFDKPVLLLHGKSDDIVTLENAVAIDKVASNSELVIFEGGHDSPNNEETLEQLKIFFAKQGLYS
jgi:uncharacterized protein